MWKARRRPGLHTGPYRNMGTGIQPESRARLGSRVWRVAGRSRGARREGGDRWQSRRRLAGVYAMVVQPISAPKAVLPGLAKLAKLSPVAAPVPLVHVTPPNDPADALGDGVLVPEPTLADALASVTDPRLQAMLAAALAEADALK